MEASCCTSECGTAFPTKGRWRRQKLPKKFAEAWVMKWDSEIRSVVANKGAGFGWVPPSEEVSRQAASRDLFRRRGHRKNWWTET